MHKCVCQDTGAAGWALERGSHPDIDACRVLERPKVLHNLETGNFVMWMHIDGSDYTWARLGVAVSVTGPLGPFDFMRSFRPHEEESRDFTVWKVQTMPLPLLLTGNQCRCSFIG